MCENIYDHSFKGVAQGSTDTFKASSARCINSRPSASIAVYAASLAATKRAAGC